MQLISEDIGYISVDCYQIWVRSAEKSLILTLNVANFIAASDN